MTLEDRMLALVVVLALIVVTWLLIRGRHGSERTPLIERFHQAPVTKLLSPRKPVQQVNQTRGVQQQQQQQKQQDPELSTLDRYLEEFQNCAHGQTPWHVLLSAGDIYARGAYPRLVPNTDLALRLFKQAAMCPDGEVAGMGQMRYIETREHPVSEADRQGSIINPTYGEQLCRLAHQRILLEPWSAFQKPVQIKRHQHPQAQTQPVADRAPLRTAGTQNVHDHAVVQTMRKNLSIWKQQGDRASKPDAVSEVTNAILIDDELSSREKSSALAVLDRVVTQADTKNESLGMSEVDALDAVWHALQSVRDAQLKKNLVNSLGKQLASGMENGLVVCSTGRIARIVSVLDGVPELAQHTVATRPMVAIKEELAALANKVRSDVLLECAPEERQAYEAGEEEALTNEMRRRFRDRADETYVRGLGLSAAVLAPLVKMYCDAL